MDDTWNHEKSIPVRIHVWYMYISFNHKNQPHYISLRIQVCPEKGIFPTILFWGWDWDHQSYYREGSGFLGYIYIYLDPKWCPLFWLKFGPCLGGFCHPSHGSDAFKEDGSLHPAVSKTLVASCIYGMFSCYQVIYIYRDEIAHSGNPIQKLLFLMLFPEEMTNGLVVLWLFCQLALHGKSRISSFVWKSRCCPCDRSKYWILSSDVAFWSYHWVILTW